YLHILAHPFFAITGPNGIFTIKGLPPGTYTLEAWHGKLGTKQLTVTVKDNESQSVEFALANP
ncbi:MAG: carboxypeptidase regulatory-like domain-containing protein, partial [Candidatus Omnitrophica bacterium]|nr:carboxypeptidase regulatory-like domain-containing protein [Candidatus Omnitrophota bacterium]